MCRLPYSLYGGDWRWNWSASSTYYVGVNISDRPEGRPICRSDGAIGGEVFFSFSFKIVADGHTCLGQRLPRVSFQCAWLSLRPWCLAQKRKVMNPSLSASLQTIESRRKRKQRVSYVRGFIEVKLKLKLQASSSCIFGLFHYFHRAGHLSVPSSRILSRILMLTHGKYQAHVLQNMLASRFWL